ncbi:MAG TPA: glycosyltransferase family 4 protein [Trueperaceae bacterium]|nr:glycosyltransferase family 4 protein [Trueperaceae bacterium]
MSRSLRIAIASIEYPTQPFSSGIGTYTQALAEGLVARGHRVHVLTRGAEGNTIERDGDLRVEYVVPARAELPERLSNSLSMAALGVRGLIGESRYRRRIAMRLHELVADEGYQLVEAADHMGEAAWYDPARHPGVPFVVRLHTPLACSERIERNVPPWVTAVAASQERRQVRRATHLTAPASATVAPMLEALRAIGRAVTVYPNPHASALRPSRPAPEPDGPPVVLFVGRLSGWKGADTLMRAVPEVLGHFPETRFVVAGADPGPSHGFDTYEAYLRSLLPPRAAGSVEFQGRVGHDLLAGHYRRATACVFPSRFEALGYACLEAMSFGKAIVGSAVGGMRELLDDGNAGLLHRPPDPADLARHIVALLGDPALRQRLGRRAFERARTRYSAERSLDAAEAFYAGAIDQLRPHATPVPRGASRGAPVGRRPAPTRPSGPTDEASAAARR